MDSASSAAESADSKLESDKEISDITAENDAELSAEAQVFITAVEALNREQIVAAVNAWALASQAWQADPENPDCCFSKRMRKVFRKNEKSMLQNCNKKAKRKGRLQRVKKPM